MVAVPVPCCGGLAPRACGVGLPEVTVSVCILNIFSWMCTAGTWPVHCVCSSYLVGCVMCGGVAKGSGTVDFFQHNHMNSTATLPCPCARLCRPAPRPGSRRELLGWREDGGRCFIPVDRRLLLWPLDSRGQGVQGWGTPLGCVLSVERSPSTPVLAGPGEVGGGGCCFGCPSWCSRTFLQGREAPDRGRWGMGLQSSCCVKGHILAAPESKKGQSRA